LSWLKREELRVKLGALATEPYLLRISREISLPLYEAEDNKGNDLPRSGSASSAQPEAYASRFGPKSADEPTARKCLIARLPTEILDQIFQYIPSVGLGSYLSGKNKKKQNVIRNGADALRVIDRQLGPARKTCKHWRIIAQRHIYRTIFISKIASYFQFVDVVLKNPELPEFIREIRIDLQQHFVPFTQRRPIISGRRNGPSVYHAAWRLYEIMGACKNLQLLNANFFGAIKAFDILDDHYPSLKALTVQDGNDPGQSAKNLWRNLQRCPQLERLHCSSYRKESPAKLRQASHVTF
jgi:hypothetical protein